MKELLGSNSASLFEHGPSLICISNTRFSLKTCTFLNIFLNQDVQQMTNNLVHLLIKIHARICQNHMHANLRNYSDNASSCYADTQRTLP